MAWRITAYNGTVWNDRFSPTMSDAIQAFDKSTRLTQQNYVIKRMSVLTTLRYYLKYSIRKLFCLIQNVF
jgi:hypothetical protein